MADNDNPLAHYEDIMSKLSALYYTPIPNKFEGDYELIIQYNKEDGGKKDLAELKDFAEQNGLYFGPKKLENEEEVVFMRLPRTSSSQ